MGLVSGLLLLPITGPVHGFRLLLERLRDEAESVLHDEGRAFAELIDLSMRHNAGLLSDAAFAEQEVVLLERLSSIRDYRDALLHGEPSTDESDSFDAEAGGEEEGSIDIEHHVVEERP